MKTFRKSITALVTALVVVVIHLVGMHSAPAAALQKPALAYVKGGDVWVQSLQGGTPRQLTQGSYVSSVAWSSSGSWLAYQDGEQLWIVQPGTDERRAIAPNVAAYAWSPQGDRLSYITEKGTTLLEVDSQNQLELPDIAATAWSPDGRELAYVTRSRLDGTEGSAPQHAVTLGRVDAATGSTQAVFNAGQPSDYDLLIAGWSADGQDILVWTAPLFSTSLLMDGTAMWAIPKQGGEPRVLVEQMLLFRDGFDLAHDNQLLVASQGGGRFTWENKRLAIAPLQSGEPKILTSDEMAALHPVFSPDGTKIVYVAGPALPHSYSDRARVLEALSQRRLWLMNRDGSEQRMLTDDAQYRDEHPVWSADGKSLVFVRFNNQSGEASLWVMDVAEGNLQQVATGLSNPFSDSIRDPGDRLLGNYGYIPWASFDVAW